MRWETALALDQGTLEHERQVIADYGNMSSPTVLFVLAQVGSEGAAGTLAADRARTRLHRKLRRACGTPRDVRRTHSRPCHAAARRRARYFRPQTRASSWPRGAVEVAARHYPLIVAVHAAWLISLWVLGHDQPVHIVALLFYLMLQGVRIWVMWTLGSRWTTRIIVSAGATAGIGGGPIDFCRIPTMP